jgi:hypothetical protein
LGLWLFDQHPEGQAIQPIPDPARHGSNSRVGRSRAASRMRAAWLAHTITPPNSPKCRPRMTLRVRHTGKTASASVTTVATSVHGCNGLQCSLLLSLAERERYPLRSRLINRPHFAVGWFVELRRRGLATCMRQLICDAWLEFYTGAMPKSVDDPVTTQRLLARLWVIPGTVQVEPDEASLVALLVGPALSAPRVKLLSISW